MTLELHPLCTLFPRLSGAEFNALRDDIKANGLRSPIVLHNGMILDGGNRYRACLDAGIEPSFKTFDGGNLVSFVLSANLHRRHMTAGQQAAIVASAQDWAKAQTAGSNQHKAKAETGPATLPDHLATVSQRAAESGASERTQRMADKVAKADPALARQVAHGEVSLPKAVAQVENKPAAKKSAKQAEAEQIANDAHGDVDLVTELEQAQQEIESLGAQLKATEADDLKAEALKWRRAYDNAVRQQSEAMDRAAKSVEREKWMARQLARCGKAVGEEDPSKIAAVVESIARQVKPARAA